MQKKAFISYKVDPKSINENISDFKELSLKDQKRFLIEILDKTNCMLITAKLMIKIIMFLKLIKAE
jgi:hypothetical protein